jgi:hypothetical protein
MTLLTMRMVALIGHDLAFTRAELQGAALVLPVHDVAKAAQAYRGAVYLGLITEKPDAAQNDALRKELERSIAALDAELARHAALNLADEWRQIKAAIAAAVASDASNKDPVVAFRKHSEPLEALRRFLVRVGENSNLLFDPEPATS